MIRAALRPTSGLSRGILDEPVARNRLTTKDPAASKATARSIPHHSYGAPRATIRITRANPAALDASQATLIGLRPIIPFKS